MNKLPLKALSALILFLAVPISPWWAVLFLIFLCTVFFLSFRLGVLIGFEMDIFYGQGGLGSFTLLFTFVACVAVFLIPFLKRRLAFSGNFDF